MAIINAKKTIIKVNETDFSAFVFVVSVFSCYYRLHTGVATETIILRVLLRSGEP